MSHGVLFCKSIFLFFSPFLHTPGQGCVGGENCHLGVCTSIVSRFLTQALLLLFSVIHRILHFWWLQQPCTTHPTVDVKIAQEPVLALPSPLVYMSTFARPSHLSLPPHSSSGRGRRTGSLQFMPKLAWCFSTPRERVRVSVAFRRCEL